MTKVLIQFNRAELENLQCGALVESWERLHGSSSTMRKYVDEFDAPERKTITRYHGVFYKWKLVTGLPDHAIMAAETYTLLQRAITFFAVN